MASKAILEIRYTSERQPQVLELEPRRYQVGSAYTEVSHERGEIPLFGLEISMIQFCLEPDETGMAWLVDPIGTTPTFLGDERIDTSDNKLFPIPPNTQIVVPGARIMVRSTLGFGLFEQTAEEWAKLQDNIYDRLFEELSIDPGDMEQNSPEKKQMLRTLLERQTTLFVNNASPTALRSAIAAALRLATLKAIAGTSSAAGNVIDDGGPQRPGQIQSSVNHISNELGLELTRDSVASDFGRLEENFEQSFEQIYGNMPVGDRRAIAKWFLSSNVWNSIFNFGPITDLMELEIITEVMVVRHDRIYVERFDKLERYQYRFSTPEQLLVIVKRLANRANREINQSSAMIDFQLTDGSRVNAIIAPLSRSGPCITIRKHRKTIRLTLDLLAGRGGSMSANMANFIKACVLARKNIIVSGGTGTGKTTLLNAMSAFIPNGERVITIEDTAELALANEHVVSLETRMSNAEGGGQVTIRDLLRNSLRMRPDRIIVGECRGGEAVDMLQALNTGHAGSMTTAHANGADEMLMRLEVMVLQGEPNLPVPAIRQQIANAVDIVVQLSRVPLPNDPGRSIKLLVSVSEVVGIHPATGDIIIEPIFQFAGFDRDRQAKFLFTGYLPTFVEEIEEVLDAHILTGPDMTKVSLEDLFITEAAA